MRLVTPQINIGTTDGFRNDLLERKSFGESLLNLIKNTSDELVISLDGKWGEGKTTFTKMWQGLLLEEGVPNIYINAYESDYVEDAFIALASEITTYVDKNIEKDNLEKVEEFKTKAKKVGVQLLSWSAKVGVKAATLGAIKASDIEELGDIKNDISKSTSNIIGSLIDEKLNNHQQEVETIQSFKTFLSELPKHLKSESNYPLVIIIDELDRCKPSYAVELLEKVKHFFSVQNVVFVLVMHKAQLEEAIKAVYGQNVDATTYLQKFINLETILPKRISGNFKNDFKIYCKKLITLHELKVWGDEKVIVDCMSALAEHFNLSLRQLEKSFTNLSILYGTSGKKYLRIVPIMSFLSVVKVINSRLYKKIIEKENNIQ